MGEIALIVESTNNHHESLYVLENFNADPRELFREELMNFCSVLGWSCADINKLGVSSETYTFVSDVYGNSSWLDHCLVFEAAWPTVPTAEVWYDVYWSEQHSLSLQFDVGMIRPTAPILVDIGSVVRQIIWGERDSAQIECYNKKCAVVLRDVDCPQELSSCCDTLCVNEDHRRVINNTRIHQSQ